MISLLVGVSFAQEPAPPVDPGSAPPPLAEMPAPETPVVPDVPASSGMIGEGWRIAAMGAPDGLRIGQEAVVGRAGGTNATTVMARGNVGKTFLQVALPFTAFRTPADRNIDVGNIGLDVWRGREGSKGYRALGVELTLPTNGRAWTWTNKPDDLWPQLGADFALQGARDMGSVKLLHRVAVGVHGSADYEPMPPLWFRVNGAVGVDATLGDRFGVTGELSLQTWDTSPLEINGLFRGRIIDGLDARAGLVLPVGVWAGWTPSDQRAGVSETTFLLDLTMSL